LRGKSGEYVMTYFLIKLPNFLAKILPASCLLSTLFSLNNLKNHSELIAILATGFSTKRIISIILTLSAAVSVFQFITVSYLDPASQKLKLNYDTELKNQKNRYYNQFH
jgi:lipopolysaccharide export LptBFGC system permease protein LptF